MFFLNFYKLYSFVYICLSVFDKMWWRQGKYKGLAPAVSKANQNWFSHFRTLRLRGWRPFRHRLIPNIFCFYFFSRFLRSSSRHSGDSTMKLGSTNRRERVFNNRTIFHVNSKLISQIHYPIGRDESRRLLTLMRKIII